MLKKKHLICTIIAFLILLQILQFFTSVNPAKRLYHFTFNDPLTLTGVDPPKLTDLFTFSDPLTPTENDLLEELLEVADKVLQSNGITYWMIEGTLIGSYRHHGRIPWDDDADIVVNNSVKMRVADVLDNYDPARYRIFSKKAAIDSIQFYSLRGRRIEGWQHRAPYVDIYFFDETDKYFWRTDPKHRKFSMLKKDVMPLSFRPYGRLWLPAPCNPSLALASFNIATCILPIYNHLNEAPLTAQPRQVPCDSLKEKLSWVRRQPLVEYAGIRRLLYSQKEELMIGDRKLREVTIDGVCRG